MKEKTRDIFWTHDLRHDLRGLSSLRLDSVRCLFDSILSDTKVMKKDGSCYFDTRGKDLTFDFKTDNVLYLSVDGEEWYYDDSTSERIIEKH